MNLRIPPQAVEVEKHVLGAMLLDREAIGVAVENLTESDFFLVKYQIMFKAISSLYGRGAATDVLSLSEELKRAVSLSMDGVEASLLEISAEVISSASIEEHCAILKGRSILRAIIGASTKSLEAAYEDGADPEQVMASAEASIFEISQRVVSQKLVHIRELMRDTMGSLAERKAGVMPGIPTGFSDFDKATGGLRDSWTYVLAARPGMGKTALAMNIATNAAETHKVAFFSLEMSDEEMCIRILSTKSGVPISTIDLGLVQAYQMPKIDSAAMSASEGLLWIDQSPTKRPIEIMSQCKRMKASTGLDLLIVDYLQLLTGNETRNMNREQEVASCSRFLKRIAMELQIPVLILSQLSRETEKRSDPRPKLSDLRESGAIEQDANVVLFLHQPYLYDESAEKNKAELIVGKGRGIPKFTTNLTFHPERTMFDNYIERGFMEGVQHGR